MDTVKLWYGKWKVWAGAHPNAVPFVALGAGFLIGHVL